jgi:hypothetical protein
MPGNGNSYLVNESKKMQIDRFTSRKRPKEESQMVCFRIQN